MAGRVDPTSAIGLQGIVSGYADGRILRFTSDSIGYQMGSKKRPKSSLEICRLDKEVIPVDLVEAVKRRAKLVETILTGTASVTDQLCAERWHGETEELHKSLLIATLAAKELKTVDRRANDLMKAWRDGSKKEAIERCRLKQSRLETSPLEGVPLQIEYAHLLAKVLQLETGRKHFVKKVHDRAKFVQVMGTMKRREDIGCIARIDAECCMVQDKRKVNLRSVPVEEWVLPADKALVPY